MIIVMMLFITKIGLVRIIIIILISILITVITEFTEINKIPKTVLKAIASYEKNFCTRFRHRFIG